MDEAEAEEIEPPDRIKPPPGRPLAVSSCASSRRGSSLEPPLCL